MGTSGQIAEAVVQTTAGGSIRAGVWTGVILAAITLATVIVRQWGPWKIIARDERRADIDSMAARIKTLEDRLDRQAAAHQAIIAAKDAQHDAELSTMRHRMNNLDQCLTMLLALIEQDPAKAQVAASRVREMRERQEATEKAERATIHAARITAASPVPDAAE